MNTEKANTENEINYSYKEIDIVNLVPNVFGNVKIFIRDGKHVLDLPSDMGSEKFRLWKKTKGYVFSKDLLRKLKNKSSGSYLLREGDGNLTVLRLIDNSELDAFQSLRLIDGMLNSKPFMHLKSVKANHKLTTFFRDEIDEVKYEPEEKIIVNNKNQENEQDEVHGKALFE